MDMLSDHLPTYFQIKIQTQITEIKKNNGLLMWNKIKAKELEEQLGDIITAESDKLLTDNDFNAGSVNEKITQWEQTVRRSLLKVTGNG